MHIAVAGATGAVGHEILDLLERRNFPVTSLRLLASARSAGKTMTFKGKEYKVEELTHNSFGGIDIAFFSAGGDRSKEFCPSAVKAGAVVIDNSSAFRMDAGVPLVVPEVTPEAAFTHKGLIANPNCTTIQMVVALKPLHDFSPIQRVVVATYQSVSGTGAKAMEELQNQTRQWAKGEPLTVEVYPVPILFNVIPQVDQFMDHGYTKEEMKMVNETRKIMGAPEIQVSATCVRVPVLRAHSEVVQIETRDKITEAKARELLAAAPGVQVVDGRAWGKYPMPRDAAQTYPVYVGRIREDLSHPRGLAFWVVADQLWKGAALNAIQIAELLNSRKK